MDSCWALGLAPLGLALLACSAPADDDRVAGESQNDFSMTEDGSAAASEPDEQNNAATSSDTTNTANTSEDMQTMNSASEPSMNVDDTGAGPAENTAPMVDGELYTLSATANASLVANGATGRIVQLNFQQQNLLTDNSVNSVNYGSSFWTSPQSTWGWPPPLDDTEYSHTLDGKAVLFTSAATAQGGEMVSVTKRFWTEAGRFVLEYTITNEGQSAIEVAPWEVTRVRSNGLSFYPTGESVTQAELSTTETDGITWIDYDNSGIEDAPPGATGLKNATDGAEGWLAHVDQGVLFLKLFENIPAGAEAPGEGEIEIYADADRDYVELEQQGALVSLEPGQTTQPWRVRWHVEQLGDELDVSLGSAALVEHVRGLLD